MKNKGFTLMELLAVIVVLAVIALIAVPIVLNITSDAKKSSQESNVKLYAKAVEISAANYRINNLYTDISGTYTVTDNGRTLINNNDSSIVLKVDCNGVVPYKTVIIYPDDSICIILDEIGEPFGILKGDLNLDNKLTQADVKVMRIILANNVHNLEIAEYLPAGVEFNEKTKNKITERLDINEDGLVNVEDLSFLQSLINLVGDLNLDNKLDEKDVAVMRIILANNVNDSQIAEYLPDDVEFNDETIQEINTKSDINEDGLVNLGDLSSLQSLIKKFTGVVID